MALEQLPSLRAARDWTGAAQRLGGTEDEGSRSCGVKLMLPGFVDAHVSKTARHGAPPVVLVPAKTKPRHTQARYLAHPPTYGGIEYFLNNSLTPLGNTFNNNICHDITHAFNDPEGGGQGLYIDNNSQLITASYNLIYRASDSLYFNNTSPNCYKSFSGFGGYFSCQNNVSNNVFAYAGNGGVKRGGTGTPSAGDMLQDFTFSTNVLYLDLPGETGPQWVNSGGTGNWECFTSTTCVTAYNFISNDYWSTVNPNAQFTTTRGGTPTPTNFASWKTIPTAEDNASPLTFLANPGFVSPGVPLDNYKFQSTTSGAPFAIGFDFSNFQSTYSAGRNAAKISPPPSPPGLPIQLLPTSQF